MNFKSRVLSEELLDRGTVQYAKKIFKLDTGLYFLNRYNTIFKINLDSHTTTKYFYNSDYVSSINGARSCIYFNNNIYAMGYDDYERKVCIVKFNQHTSDTNNAFNLIFDSNNYLNSSSSNLNGDFINNAIAGVKGNIYIASMRQLGEFKYNIQIFRLNADEYNHRNSTITQILSDDSNQIYYAQGGGMISFNDELHYGNAYSDSRSLTKININNGSFTVVSKGFPVGYAQYDNIIGELNGKLYFSDNRFMNSDYSFTQYNYNQNTITGGGIVDNSLLVNVGSDLKFIDKKIYEEI